MLRYNEAYIYISLVREILYLRICLIFMEVYSMLLFYFYYWFIYIFFICSLLFTVHFVYVIGINQLYFYYSSTGSTSILLLSIQQYNLYCSMYDISNNFFCSIPVFAVTLITIVMQLLF